MEKYYMNKYIYNTESNKKKDMIHSVPFFIDKQKIFELDKVHIHDFSQLTIVTGGSGKIIVNGHENVAKEGDVYVVSKYTPHALAESKDLEIVFILFFLEDLLKYVGELKIDSGFQLMFVLQASLNNRMALTNMLHLKYDELVYIQKIISSLIREIAERKQGFELVIRSYFLILITFISRSYENNKIGESYPSGKIYKAVAFMEENYDKQINVDELAKITCLSERQFRRIFTDKYGVSPSQYFTSIRMQQACYLLKTTEMTISEISDQVGIPDSNYFSRQFKKNIGMTPKAYRNVKNE